MDDAVLVKLYNINRSESIFGTRDGVVRFKKEVESRKKMRAIKIFIVSISGFCIISVNWMRLHRSTSSRGADATK